MSSTKLFDGDAKRVQQHDEVESSKTCCRSQSRVHGKAYEQMPALICNTRARRLLFAATIWGVEPFVIFTADHVL